MKRGTDGIWRTVGGVEAKGPQLGATGEFPEGKVDDTDEGELRLAIAYDPATNLVRIEFGKPVAWLAMDPEKAIQFAEAITREAKS